MGSPPMVTRTNSTARLLGVAASTLALATGATALPSGPAHAADTITAADQPYFAYYHLDQARAKGYTGQGVTIAILDGEVDTSAPELTGADITDKSPCTVTSSTASISHGTAMAALLVAHDYGIAPNAKILSYRLVFSDDSAGSDCSGVSGIDKNEASSLINTAINDGAQIISISSSNKAGTTPLKWAIARAISQGIIITAAAGNDAKNETDVTYEKWSGVIGVTAIDINGNFQDYSSWGEGVVSAAVGGPLKARNYSNGQLEEVNGTSVSTPLVAGSLALARQKWPQATTNQLLQLLIHTGTNPDHTWNKYTGQWSTRPPASIRMRILWQSRTAVPVRRPTRLSSTPTVWSLPLRSPTTTPTYTGAWTRTRSATAETPTPLTWGPARATTASKPTGARGVALMPSYGYQPAIPHAIPVSGCRVLGSNR